jgi:hypothetical protein
MSRTTPKSSRKTQTTRRRTKRAPAPPPTPSDGEKVLVLRTCKANLTAYGGFKWPAEGPVAAPDWSPVAECGNGLHGLLFGEGNGGLVSWETDAKWLVVEVLASEIVKLDEGQKVKFPRGDVVFCGDRLGATEFLAARAPGRAIVGLTATAGDSGTATAGDSGTATAGYKGTATAGDSGTATAGDSGTATAGYKGTATAGYKGTATAGYKGTATAGYKGTATAGYKGTATAGDYGTATAGYKGTATAGYKGTATAGDYGILSMRWYDGKRFRVATFYVGEDGIEARVPYQVSDEGGKPVKVMPPQAESAAG